MAVLVGVLYDPIVFLSESECPGIQECVEEGTIHIVAHGSSSLSDQATIVPERLAELDGMSEPVVTDSGIEVVDTLRFFKGDKPAAQFEAGISCGGHYPCVGCVCSSSKGLSAERQWYLFEAIRPFYSGDDKDIVCPLPSVAKPTRRGGTPVRLEQPEDDTGNPPPKRSKRTCGICNKEGYNKRSCPQK